MITRQPNRVFDVIIVGGGPAGSSLAYFLAREGVKVILMEKTAFPRYKPCGGSFPPKVEALLGFDVAGVVSSKAFGVAVHFEDEHSIVAKRQSMLVFTVMRDEFDHLLFRKASSVGALCIDKTKAVRFNIDTKEVTVTTDSNVAFKAKILVGADGAASRIASLIGIKRKFGLAISCEMVADNDFFHNYGSFVNVIFGRTRGITGYSFPKRDHYTVGLIDNLPHPNTLAHNWQQLTAKLGLGERMPRKYVAPLPYVIKGENFGQHRVLVVGDAAGLVDPLTGEGVYYAIKSAIIAAGHIKQSLASNDFHFDDYSRQIRKDIVKELRIAGLISKIYNFAPSMFYRVARYAPSVLQTCLDVVEGKAQYNNAMVKVVSELLLNIIASHPNKRNLNYRSS